MRIGDVDSAVFYWRGSNTYEEWMRTMSDFIEDDDANGFLASTTWIRNQIENYPGVLIDAHAMRGSA